METEEDRGGRVRQGYVVTGRVQGVGFRYWTRETAMRLGLGGHVRNRLDGAVEAHVVGSPERVRAFEEALWRGPPAARVEDVTPIEGDQRVVPDRFDMERW